MWSPTHKLEEEYVRHAYYWEVNGILELLSSSDDEEYFMAGDEGDSHSADSLVEESQSYLGNIQDQADDDNLQDPAEDVHDLQSGEPSSEYNGCRSEGGVKNLSLIHI